MTLDEQCKEANERLQRRLEERIAEGHRQLRREAEHAQRSIAQRFRRLREELLERK